MIIGDIQYKDLCPNCEGEMGEECYETAEGDYVCLNCHTTAIEHAEWLCEVQA